MLRRTPALAILIAGVISILIVFIFEIHSRPFTTGQGILLYLISLLPSLGISLLFDTISREESRKLYQINFYEEKNICK